MPWADIIFDVLEIVTLDTIEFGGSSVQLGYERCRRCTADLNKDMSKNRKRCSSCNKRISHSQVKKWRFYNRR